MLASLVAACTGGSGAAIVRVGARGACVEGVGGEAAFPIKVIPPVRLAGALRLVDVPAPSSGVTPQAPELPPATLSTSHVLAAAATVEAPVPVAKATSRATGMATFVALLMVSSASLCVQSGTPLQACGSLAQQLPCPILSQTND
jgi:hypothetical protein